LSEKLEAAARELARGERSEPRKALRDFVVMLDAQHDHERRERGAEPGGDRERDRRLLSARAYLLLKANAQYLLGRI